VHATVRSAAYGAYEAAEAEFTIYVVPKVTEIKSVKIANDKGTKMKVSWKKNETAGGYRIQYSTDSDFEDDVEVINLQGNQTTSKTISDLKAGKTYYVRIQALSKGSTELTASWSDTASLKVVSAPATTKLSKAVNKKGKKIKATWKKTSGASGYEIQYSTDKAFKSAKTIKVKGGSSTSKTIKGLKKKTYYVRIRTVKTVDGNNFYAKWSGYRTVKVSK
jgi:fibronectin type 3 domain-containing protein